MNTLKSFFTSEFAYFRNIIFHKNTPRSARLIMLGAVLYVLFPFDILPDFIPLSGILDDIIVAPILLKVALNFVPESVKKDAKPNKK